MPAPDATTPSFRCSASKGVVLKLYLYGEVLFLSRSLKEGYFLAVWFRRIVRPRRTTEKTSFARAQRWSAYLESISLSPPQEHSDRALLPLAPRVVNSLFLYHHLRRRYNGRRAEEWGCFVGDRGNRQRHDELMVARTQVYLPVHALHPQCFEGWNELVELDRPGLPNALDDES